MIFRGDEVERRRIFAGLSRADLAEPVGVTSEAIRQIERYGQQPRPALAKAIAETLGVEVSELWAA